MPYDRRPWLGHLFTLRGSVLPKILPRLVIVGVAAAVSIELHANGHVPTLPSTFHALLGTALALLVTFRTNSSYDRFWEGRKAWGAIVNRSRDITLVASASLGPERTRRIARLVAAFAHAAKRELWQSKEMPELARLVGIEESKQLARPPGAAQRALLHLGRELALARASSEIDLVAAWAAQDDVTALIDQLGACQRIQRTPIPFAYVVHLRWLLVIYCATLPFALIESLDNVHTIVVVLLVSFALFGIEQIGVEIEDPFGDTVNDIQLGAIADTIERDVIALADDTDDRGAAAASPVAP
jgi:putative membrane protein